MTISLKFSPSGINAVGFNQSEDFTFSVTPKNTVIGSSSGNITSNDSVYQTITPSSVDNNFQVDAVAGTLSGTPIIALDPSSTPNCAAIDGNGNVTRQTVDGTAVVTITGKTGVRKYSQQLIRTLSGPVVYSWENFATGSLALAAYNEMVSLTNGTSSGGPLYDNASVGTGSQARFSSLSGSAAVKNSAFFLNSINMTWRAAWSVHAGVGSWDGGLHLISKRHVLVASHVTPFPSSASTPTTPGNGNSGATNTSANSVSFLGSDGNLYTANLWNGITLNNADGISIDIGVGYLTSDIPSVVTPIKVLPGPIQNYLTGTNLSLNPIPLPVIGCGGFGSSFCTYNLNLIGDSVFGIGNVGIQIVEPINPFMGWLQPGTVFALSSTPIFLVVDLGHGNGPEPILLANTYEGDRTSLAQGFSISDNIAQINTAMNTLSAAFVAAGGTDSSNGTYALTQANMSNFTLF